MSQGIGILSSPGISMGSMELVFDFLANTEEYEPELSEVKAAIHNKKQTPVVKKPAVKPRVTKESLINKFSIVNNQQNSSTDNVLSSNTILKEVDDFDFSFDDDKEETRTNEVDNENIQEDEKEEIKYVEYNEDEDNTEENNMVDMSEFNIDENDLESMLDDDNIDMSELDDDDELLNELDDEEDEDSIADNKKDSVEDYQKQTLQVEQHKEEKSIENKQINVEDSDEDNDEIDASEFDDDIEGLFEDEEDTEDNSTEISDDDEDIEGLFEDDADEPEKKEQTIENEQQNIPEKHISSDEKINTQITEKQVQKSIIDETVNKTDVHQIDQNKQVEELQKQLEEQKKQNELLKQLNRLKEENKKLEEHQKELKSDNNTFGIRNEKENLDVGKKKSYLDDKLEEGGKPLKTVKTEKEFTKYDMYAAMTIEAFYGKVKEFMLARDVRHCALDIKVLDNEFGAENIKKLITKQYLIKTKKGVTVGI